MSIGDILRRVFTAVDRRAQIAQASDTTSSGDQLLKELQLLDPSIGTNKEKPHQLLVMISRQQFNHFTLFEFYEELIEAPQWQWLNKKPTVPLLGIEPIRLHGFGVIKGMSDFLVLINQIKQHSEYMSEFERSKSKMLVMCEATWPAFYDDSTHYTSFWRRGMTVTAKHLYLDIE